VREHAAPAFRAASKVGCWERRRLAQCRIAYVALRHWPETLAFHFDLDFDLDLDLDLDLVKV
jgi:hypothetical protein